MGDVWIGVVWPCILIFVWLRGKLRVGEWCCEVVGSCEVRFSASSQPDKTCMRVCVCVSAGAGVHISRGSRSVRGRVLPVRDVRRVHRAVAGAAVQLSIGAAHVRGASHHHVDSLHAYPRHHRQEVT